MLQQLCWGGTGRGPPDLLPWAPAGRGSGSALLGSGGSACSVAASFSLLFEGCRAFVQMFSPSSDLLSSCKATKRPVRAFELSWRSGAPACCL